MSKNKYRLTKQKYEKFGPVVKIIEKNKVILKDELRTNLTTEDLINNYVNHVQKGKRQKVCKKDILINHDKITKTIEKSIPITLRVKEDSKDCYTNNIIQKIINEDEDQIKEWINLEINFLNDSLRNRMEEGEFNKGHLLKAMKDSIVKQWNENSKEDYFILHIRKIVYKRYKKSLQETDLKIDTIKSLEELQTKIYQIKEGEILIYVLNKFKMNLIDVGKSKLYKENNIEISDSLKLEEIRQQELLNSKFSEVISRANSMLTIDKEIKLNSDSFDIFGGNSNLIDLNAFDSKAAGEVLKKLNEKWQTKDSVEEAQEKIKKVIKYRLNVVHFKKNAIALEVNDEIIDTLSKKYLSAIYTKYLSNDIHNYYHFEFISGFIKDNKYEEIEILENNYLPRFSKVLKKYKDIDVKGDAVELECKSINKYLEANTATKFLLKEIYMNSFKAECDKFKISAMKNVISVTKKRNTKYDFKDCEFSEKSFNHIEYKKINRQIQKGNYELMLSVWEMYIAKLFYDFVEDEFKGIFISDKLDKEDVGVTLKNLQKESNVFDTMCEVHTQLLTHPAYLLSMLLTRRECGELINGLVCYYQFLSSKCIESNKKDLKKLIKILKFQMPFLQLPIEDYESDEFQSILKVITNDYDKNANLEFYNMSNDIEKVQIVKNLRFIYEQNAVVTLQKLSENSIVYRKINEEEFDRLNKRVVKEVKKLKDMYRKKYNSSKNKKKNIFVETPSIETIRDWECRNRMVYQQNMNKLYTPVKILNFVIEIHSLFTRMVRGIERDILLLSLATNKIKRKDVKGGMKLSEIRHSSIKFPNITEKQYDEFVGKKDAYPSLRNQIAHYNYFNDDSFDMTLKDIFEKIYYLLDFNIKRRKSFKEALIYIFKKNNIILNVHTTSRNKLEFHYTIECHPFSEKKINKNSWNKLKLITEEEKRLLVKVFEGKNE